MLLIRAIKWLCGIQHQPQQWVSEVCDVCTTPYCFLYDSGIIMRHSLHPLCELHDRPPWGFESFDGYAIYGGDDELSLANPLVRTRTSPRQFGVLRRDWKKSFKDTAAYDAYWENKYLEKLAIIEKFKELEYGWATGISNHTETEPSGEVIDAEGLDWLADVLVKRPLVRLPWPSLSPTPEGGVEAEWDRKRFYPSLEINLRARTGEYHGMDMVTDKSWERTLNLNRREDWIWLSSELERLGIRDSYV